MLLKKGCSGHQWGRGGDNGGGQQVNPESGLRLLPLERNCKDLMGPIAQQGLIIIFVGKFC